MTFTLEDTNGAALVDSRVIIEASTWDIKIDQSVPFGEYSVRVRITAGSGDTNFFTMRILVRS